MREEKEASEVLKRLAKVTNQEIIRRNCTIKGFAATCGISYETMRNVVLSKAPNIQLSTMLLIINNIPCVSLEDIFEDKEKDIVEEVFNEMFFMRGGTKYSVSARAYR